MGEGLAIELCEEVIRYRPSIAAGIDVFANIILRSNTPEAQYLGVWHRASVGPFSIADTQQWAVPGEFASHVFFSMCDNRGRVEDGATLAVRLFTSTGSGTIIKEEETPAIIIPRVDDSPEAIHISHPLETLLNNDLPEPRLRPYTYSEIGPFMGEDAYYAIRISFHIPEAALNKLVIENTIAGTRTYEVYGVAEIEDKIRWLDLPELLLDPGYGNAHKCYTEWFDDVIVKNHLCPRFYSVVAIDSPDSIDYSPGRLYAITLKYGLEDLTSHISERLYEHEALFGLRGRVYWFVGQEKCRDFLLWLEGPTMKVVHPEAYVQEVLT